MLFTLELQISPEISVLSLTEEEHQPGLGPTESRAAPGASDYISLVLKIKNREKQDEVRCSSD